MKYQCDMIRDLMPLCADGAASDASRQAVREHIGTCVECARCWSEVQQGLDLDAKVPSPKEKDFVKAAKRYRRKWLLRMLAVFFCGFLVTWSVYQIYIGSPYYHGRKTVDAAIQEALSGGKGRRFGINIPFETKLKYDAPDGSYSIYFVNWVLPQDENYVIPVTVTKNKKGLYTAKQDAQQVLGACPIPDRLNMQPVNDHLIFCFVDLNDPAVKKLRVTLPDGEHQVDTNESGRAYFLCEHAESYDDASGEALDTDGHVLYRLRVMKPTDYEAEHTDPAARTRLFWEKTS